MIRVYAIAFASTLAGTVASAQNFEAAQARRSLQSQVAVSAVRVGARQESVSSQQTAVGSRSSMKAFAHTVVAMETSAQMREAVGNAESMQIGSTGLCANVAQAKGGASSAKSGQDVRAALSDFEVKWMTDGGSRSEMLAATQDIRRGVMCSSREMAEGLCHPEARSMTGVIPAGDTNAAPWLLRRNYGTQEAELGAIYTDTIAPPPTMQGRGEAKTVDELVRHGAARRQMALVSIARGALMDVVVSGMEGSSR